MSKSRSRQKRFLRRLKRGTVALLAVSIAFLVWVYAVPFPKGLLSRDSIHSMEIVDREGRPLREVLSAEEGRARWLSLGEISPFLIDATIAIEDQRFRSHAGVDPAAVLRAAWQNVRHRRRVSGASTISMQVVRLLMPRPRTLRVKASEAVLALRLERALGKDEILEEYLNRAPYGNQLFGVESAARMYFNKPAADLSLSEAALLAGLPQSPSRLNPYRNLRDALARRDRVLDRMHARGMIDEPARRRAVAEPVSLHPRRWPFRAPHFVQNVLSRYSGGLLSGRMRIETTLGLPLQEQVQGIVREEVRALEHCGVRSGAVVVVHNPTGEIRAMVGSRDFFDEENLGQNNGAVAPRPPGSTVKAFTYTLAFEQGMTPADIVADLPTHFETPHGDYCPENYDGRHYGPMRLRAALANSLNIPALRTLSKVGVDVLYRRMREAGFSHLREDPQHYGLGLTLGSGEVTLLELCNGFATIARKGEWRPVVARKGASSQPAKRVFDPIACAQTIDILSDARARVMAFGENTPLNLPFRVAAKTGTSPNFRDNWTVGFTPEYTVAVWVGDFRNNPMQNISGITGAGPIFHAVMLAVHENERPTGYADPPGTVRRDVCSLSGMRPGPGCGATVKELFRAGTEPQQECTYHRRIGNETYVRLPPEYEAWAKEKGIAQPPDASSRRDPAHERVKVVYPNSWDVFVIDPTVPAEYQTVSLRAVAKGSDDDLAWFVDGEPVPVSAHKSPRWRLRRGEHAIVARAPDGTSSKPVTIRVE